MSSLGCRQSGPEKPHPTCIVEDFQKGKAHSAQPVSWRYATLFLLTLTAVVCCLLFVHQLLFSIVGAITLAVVTQPLSTVLRRRISSTATGAVMVLLLSAALLLPSVLLATHLVQQVEALFRYVQSGGLESFLEATSLKHPKVGQTLQNGMAQLAPGASGKQIAAWLAPRVAGALHASVQGVADLVLLLFFYFFLVRDEVLALSTLRGLLPLRSDEAFDITRKLADVISAIFAGRILIAMAQGVVAGLAYWVLGVPGALLWGFVTFLCCLVPAFGAFLAWVPICIYLGLAQSWTKSLILALWCGGVVSTMDNFLYPVLVGKKADLHTAVILIAIFGGLAWFGISGFIIGPVAVVTATLLLQRWRVRTQGEDSLSA